MESRGLSASTPRRLEPLVRFESAGARRKLADDRHAIAPHPTRDSNRDLIHSQVLRPLQLRSEALIQGAQVSDAIDRFLDGVPRQPPGHLR